MRVVVKIGTSSVTDDHGRIDTGRLSRFCRQVVDSRSAGHEMVVVSSGAIAAGLPALGMSAEHPPQDPVTLQAVSAVGQSRLMRVYDQLFGEQSVVAGQVLLAPLDFGVRQQYLHARSTLERLLELGVVPIVNENDAIADDEIRFGDNDRLAALVANLVSADMLLLLTDTPGLLSADPRLEPGASLIEEVVEFDHTIEAAAGGAGTARGSGGMASKIAAAKIASWSGIRTVIASAERPNVIADAVAGRPGVGTVVHPRKGRLSARKVWIAFARPAEGRIRVDEGAVRALLGGNASLLCAGVVDAEGDFEVDDAVEIVGPDGGVVAKGITKMSASDVKENAGRRSSELPDGLPRYVVHRDDLVVLG
ncbi:MAG: glutamate 5-kinase [Acidimicrobiales bacterium]|nr:MAG: glutamate 5-kinase [Acidimicrobiales bacterium]